MKKEFKIYDSYEFIGKWWIPGYEDDQAIGKLYYNSGKLLLELESYFKHMIGISSNEDIEIIHGFASGYKVTLYNCFVKSLVIPPLLKIAEYAPVSIIANNAVIGLLLPSEQELDIEYVVFQPANIKNWTYLTGFSGYICYKKEGEEKYTYNMSYTLPDKEVIFTNEKVGISLGAGTSIPSSFTTASSVVFSEINFFFINNVQKQSGLFFFEYIDALRKFLTFVLRAEIEIENIKTYLQDGSYGSVLYNPIQLSLDYKKPETSSAETMFFSYPSVKDRIDDLFSCWISYFADIPEVFNLYFYCSRGMLYDIFTSKAQALEEYHRATKANSNQWGYKRRIEDLFDRFHNVMSYRGEKEIFAMLVRDHRDYYTHWFKKKKEKVFHGLHLDYLTRDVNLLLEMCLLSCMGFNDDEVTEIILNYLPYRNYLGLHSSKDDKGYPKDRIVWVS